MTSVFRSSDMLLLAVSLVIFSHAHGDLGPLHDIVIIGEDGAWRGAVTRDGYRLTNEIDPGAIRYYYGPYDPSTAGRREVELRVDVSAASPEGRAGLLYGLDTQTRHYFLIVLGPRGEFDIFRRDANGFNRTMSSVVDSAQAAVTLRLTENGAEVTVSVDGRRVGSFESTGTGRGATGIAAMGAGSFLFSDYRESVAGGSSSREAQAPLSAQGVAARVDTRSGPWTQRTLRDEFGFERPVDAYNVRLPADWSLNGAVQWYGEAGCQMDSNKLHFMATSPDGSERIEFIPGGTWGWVSLYDAMPQLRQNNISGCAVRRILDAQSFIDEYLPAIRPGATVLASRQRPDLAQMLRKSAGNIATEPGQRFDFQVLQLSIRYTVDGKQIYETMLPSLMFMTMPGPDPYGGTSGVTLVAQALGTIAGARVGGPVDETLLFEVAESIAILPDYQQRLSSYYEQKAQLMAAALRRRQAAQQQYLAARRAASASSAPSSAASTGGSDVLDIQFEGWKRRDAMTSAGQSRVVDGIAERQAYTNNTGQIVYMPSQYQRVYQLPNDVYVGTNDAFFNPVQQTGQFGEQLPRHDYEQ